MTNKWKSSPVLALTALILITSVWGSTFLLVQMAVNKMPVMDFLGFRFAIAALFMLLIRPTCLRHITRKGLLRGFLLGILLGMGYITQTYGLLYASATVSGFITGMFVVLTPVISWLILRRKTGISVWIATVLATVGLAFISLKGWSFGFGELLTLACAVFYAAHIVGLGEYSSKHDVYSFTLIQMATVAIICMIAAIPGGITVPPDGAVWGIIAVTAVLASALAFLVQTWAQSLVSATRAAVVMTMEPVFAGVFGVLIGGDNLTIRIIIGAILILSAMLLVQITPARTTTRIES